jgi:hypothetical protein
VGTDAAFDVQLDSGQNVGNEPCECLPRGARQKRKSGPPRRSDLRRSLTSALLHAAWAPCDGLSHTPGVLHLNGVSEAPSRCLGCPRIDPPGAQMRGARVVHDQNDCRGALGCRQKMTGSGAQRHVDGRRPPLPCPSEGVQCRLGRQLSVSNNPGHRNSSLNHRTVLTGRVIQSGRQCLDGRAASPVDYL